jgi:Zn-dependent protease
MAGKKSGQLAARVARYVDHPHPDSSHENLLRKERSIIDIMPLRATKNTVLYTAQRGANVLFAHDLTTLALATLAFIVAVSLHEANHAFVATALGDDTPRRYGRLSLNPLRHLDPLGVLMFILAGVGWGSTPVSPWKLRPSPRVGSALVAAAGPLANLMLAYLFSLLLRAGAVAPPLPPLVHEFLVVAVALNLLLFVFNLLPLPPLDGFSVLLGLVPEPLAAPLKQLERLGPGPILLLLLLIPLTGINVIQMLFAPVAAAFGLSGLR